MAKKVVIQQGLIKEWDIEYSQLEKIYKKINSVVAECRL